MIQTTSKSIEKFAINSLPVEQVTQIKYLGAQIQANSNNDAHVERRRTLSQIDMFKTSEGNIIKKMLYLPSGSKTTELLNSFNLDTTINHVRNQKLCFYLQLRKNSYTNEILTQITKMNNSINFVHEIRCLLNSNSSTSMETLDDRATMEIREMKHQVGKSKEKSKQILSLLKAYEISSPKNRTYQIRTILMTYNQSECVHPSNRSIKY